MRPSARLLSLEVSGSRTLYVCSSCRQEARPRPVLARQFLRNASSGSTPLTEKVRRKLWGTENPPGLKDPYGGPGALEKKLRGNQNVQEEGAAEVESAEPAEVAETAGREDPDYVPATSWEGIEKIGHLGGWQNYPASQADEYSPFMLKQKLTKREHLYLAAHQTAVELCLLHALKKPLSSIYAVAEHDKSVFKMIWKCKIQPGANGEWDGVLAYPNKQTEAALVYIFEQIGGQPEAAIAEAAGETEQAEAEAEAPAEELDEDTYVSETLGLPFFGYQDVRDKGFLSLALNDPAAKFAFLKRFSQLSGHFPDPTLHSISNVKEVVDLILKTLNPKPTKLADQLFNKTSLQNRSNVKIFAKKQKASDRDEEMGRKKVIEAELRARGLIA
ncbi:hypothetical protein SI65_07571 [Aspergillus cristatus]|uniref:Large ribosomal subunit protein mL50 n=1 Tax=Aspergillus cristatus TaxID=573508 RepID=A0A1E3B879_ASPCR|nr:hypothetical protein SI65_07571 [Aspergillus cristatus]